MKLLNSYIVDDGTKYNNVKRVVYMTVNGKNLINVRKGETFRFIPWNSFSRDIKHAEEYRNDENSILIKLNIEENCYNAGLINCFGKSIFECENETLIPPYSVWIVKQKKENKIVLDLAKDNSEYGFDMRPMF